MSNLESLMSEIKEKKKVISSDPGPDPGARRVRLGHIRRAKEDLVNQIAQYKEELQRRAAFIIVTGSQSKKYSDLASSDKFGCFAVDPDSFYMELIDKIPPRLYINQTSSPSLFDHIGTHFETKAMSIGVIGYPAFLFESKYKKALKGKDDVLNLTKRAFNDKIGGEVVAIDAVSRIAEKAIEEGFDSKVCPIILHTEDVELIKELENGIKRTLTSNVFVITTGVKNDKNIKEMAFDAIRSVTEKSVKDNLLKIRKTLL